MKACINTIFHKVSIKYLYAFTVRKVWFLFYSSSDSIKTRLAVEEYPFSQRFRFWPTAILASWTKDDAPSDCNIVDATSAVSVGAAFSAGVEEEDADMHANKNPDDDDDDDDEDDDDEDDDDDDNSVGNELELVEQRKTQSSLLSLSSSLTSVKSIISAVAVRLADFNTTLPSQCTDLA